VGAAVRDVVTADRRSPSDPRLAYVVALGRLRLAAAFAATSVLFAMSFGLGWLFGDPTFFGVAGGVVSLFAALAAVVLFSLVVPALGTRARHLRTASALALAATTVAAAISALAPSAAFFLFAFAVFAALGCALTALSWSAHLGSGGRVVRNSFRTAPLALALGVLAVVCGVAAFVVRPLLVAPEMSLGQIVGVLSGSAEGPALVLVNVIGIAVVLIGVSATIVLLALGARGGWLRPSTARALTAAAGVGLIVFEFLFSFGTVMNLLDSSIATGTDGAVTEVLGVIGVVLAAFALLEGARHPYPSPRALAA
jgi:hypothetical protein